MRRGLFLHLRIQSWNRIRHVTHHSRTMWKDFWFLRTKRMEGLLDGPWRIDSSHGPHVGWCGGNGSSGVQHQMKFSLGLFVWLVERNRQSLIYNFYFFTTVIRDNITSCAFSWLGVTVTYCSFVVPPFSEVSMAPSWVKKHWKKFSHSHSLPTRQLSPPRRPSHQHSLDRQGKEQGRRLRR